MEELFRERKKKLKSFKSFLNRNHTQKKKEVPNGIYVKCKSCNKLVLSNKMQENLYVCPSCGFHNAMPSRDRLEEIFDDEYHELNTHSKIHNPLNFPGYDKKIEGLKDTTDLDEAVICATGLINDIKTVVCVMDNSFLMGSMGSVVGEKITRAIEYAIKRKRPLIIFTTSGGARMQEGIYSLMQMAKTSAALKKHHNAGLLYISYLTNPTTGGVTASFASLGDIVIAEPKALIAFAGPRVIESTIKQTLPEGFQRSEFLLEHGFVDLIVSRKDMKQTLSNILSLHKGG